jgi:hypothetical protein
MTDNFRELCALHLAKIEINESKIKFIDKLIQFYSEYIGIIKTELDALEKDLTNEFNDVKDDLPIENVIRFDEKLREEIRQCKMLEEKKIRDGIDWLLETRTHISNNE